MWNTCPAKRLTIYISHASEDQQPSDALRDFLHRDGFDPWLCEIDVPAGADWRGEMDRARNAAEVFLFIVSNDNIIDGTVEKVEEKTHGGKLDQFGSCHVTTAPRYIRANVSALSLKGRSNPGRL